LYEAQSNRHRLVKVHATLEQIYTSLGDPLAAAQSGRERFRLRDELIGTQATGKLGELLSRFELGEERRRSELLMQENAVTELKLRNERQELRLIYLVAATIAVALLLLGWRHFTVRRLYRLLHDQNQVVLVQAAQLRQVNQQLTEQSERLYRASITDALTGVGNRAYGMQRLHELIQASAAGRHHAVMLIDVDLFKAINDNHGHPVGDQVLVTVARALQQALPEGAVLSRVGGEDFMVLIEDADRRQLFDIGNALRAQVRAASIDVGGQRIAVSISIGICALADLPQATPHQAYAAADDALYRAKRGGRDCVCMHAHAEVDARTVG
jgi:diguanylate cyclase (GGDEF)-like protein